MTGVQTCALPIFLSGGWHQDWYSRARQLIEDQIVKDGVDNLLAGVPDDESELFLHDLKILKLI